MTDLGKEGEKTKKNKKKMSFKYCKNTCTTHLNIPLWNGKSSGPLVIDMQSIFSPTMSEKVLYLDDHSCLISHIDGLKTQLYLLTNKLMDQC